MTINIKKRNGSLEPLCVEKTKKMVAFACEGLEGCDPVELELDSKIQFIDGMSTKEIQKVLIQTAIEKVIQTKADAFGNAVNATNVNWQYVAARLFVFDLYKTPLYYHSVGEKNEDRIFLSTQTKKEVFYGNFYRDAKHY